MRRPDDDPQAGRGRVRQAGQGADGREVTSVRANAHLVRMFRQWSRAAHLTAVARQARGDEFGTLLATARAKVYALAAELATGLTRDRLAAECARGEVTHAFGNPDGSTLADVDWRAVAHTRAMAWQFCALAVDPHHRPVERPW